MKERIDIRSNDRVLKTQIKDFKANKDISEANKKAVLKYVDLERSQNDTGVGMSIKNIALLKIICLYFKKKNLEDLTQQDLIKFITFKDKEYLEYDRKVIEIVIKKFFRFLNDEKETKLNDWIKVRVKQRKGKLNVI